MYRTAKKLMVLCLALTLSVVSLSQTTSASALQNPRNQDIVAEVN